MSTASLADGPFGRMIEALSPGILDIGARGGADEELLAIAWASRFIGFEPDEAEAEQLSRAGDPRWREFSVLPFAVGGASGPAVLHVPASRQGASLLRHNEAPMVERFGRENLHVVREQIPVKTWTLDDLLSGGRIAPVDYIKIDVEGTELDILKAGTSILRDCVALKVECSFLPQRLSQPLVWEVVQFLLGVGFEVVDIQDTHRWRRRNLPPHPYRVEFDMEYSRGQVAQCDVVLLRSVERLHDNRQALRLVVLAAALGFFDYGIAVMRAIPKLPPQVQEDYGIDLETELKRWSGSTGRREVRRAIASSIRGLVPLLRAWAGRLPFPKTSVPY